MEFLSQQQIPFIAKDVRNDPEALRELAALGSQSTPTIVVNGKVMVGFNPSKLLSMLGKDTSAEK